MIHKMLAAVVEQFGKPLAFRELDTPSPGPGQILVKTEACGVRHTDLHAATWRRAWSSISPATDAIRETHKTAFIGCYVRMQAQLYAIK
jgi:threonine dehydrogenase-like Zn-dependent dehydrogenase